MGKAEKTRQLIIKKTAPIFNRQGYAGTSLSDLTEATGLTKGSIYGNFKDKNEVALHALKYNLNLIITAFGQEREGVFHAVDLLLSYPRAYNKIYKILLEQGGCPILNTLTDADDTHAELARMALMAIKRWRRDIIGILEKGKKAGEIKSEVDSSGLAESLISLIEGGSFLAKSTGENSYMKNAIALTERLIHEAAK